MPTIIFIVEKVPSLATSGVLGSILYDGVRGVKVDDSAGDTKVVPEYESNCSSSSSESFDFMIPRPFGVNR